MLLQLDSRPVDRARERMGSAKCSAALPPAWLACSFLQPVATFTGKLFWFERVPATDHPTHCARPPPQVMHKNQLDQHDALGRTVAGVEEMYDFLARYQQKVGLTACLTV